jgi:hypothetical protein
MRTGLDFKSAQLIKSEAKPRIGSKCEDLKSSPVLVVGPVLVHLIRINHYLIKVR